MADLVIVESPTKARALRGFLGRSYRVVASMGHIRDLPPKKLGVDVERNLLLIKGSVPGSNGGDVIITPAVKMMNKG